MSGQDGANLLLKIGDGASPQIFTTIGGCRTNQIALNEEMVDITNKSSANKMRELLRAGVKSVSCSGEGVFVDDAAIETVRGYFFATDGLFVDFELIVPDFGTFMGPFLLTNLTFDGPDKDAVQQNMGVESAGDVAFTAV